MRRRWQADTNHFEAIFDACGAIATEARAAIEAGELDHVGRLMNDNHEWLVRMTVSSPELDRLVQAALINAAVVVTLTWLVMPSLTTWFHGWLHLGLGDSEAIRLK